jgi:hypothetical protein
LVHAVVELPQLGHQGARVLALAVGLSQGLAQLGVTPQQLHFVAAVAEHLLQHRALRIELGFLIHQHDARLR